MISSDIGKNKGLMKIKFKFFVHNYPFKVNNIMDRKNVWLFMLGSEEDMSYRIVLGILLNKTGQVVVKYSNPIYSKFKLFYNITVYLSTMLLNISFLYCYKDCVKCLIRQHYNISLPHHLLD